MPNSFRKLTFVTLLALLGLGLFASGTAQAQGGECGGYGECIFSDTFDSDVSGWSVLNGQTIIEWKDYIETTNTNWSWLAGWRTDTTDANGVFQATFVHGDPLQFSHFSNFQKTISLSPGTYKIVIRGGPKNSANIHLRLSDNPDNTDTADSFLYTEIQAAGGFHTYHTNEFQVNWPTAASLEFLIEHDAAEALDDEFWLDFVFIVKTSNAYSTFPAGTGTPAPVATQMPIGAPYCQPVSTPTPTAPVPSYLITPAPTATPVVLGGNDVAVIDTFTDGIGEGWTQPVGAAAGSLAWVDTQDHSPLGSAGAIRLRTEMDATPNDSMVYPFASAVTRTVYLDGWAMSDPITAGISVSVEVWYERADTNAWVYVTAIEISHFNWYPFHAVIAPTGGINAVFIKVHRSDSATDRYAYLDDLFLYNDPSFAPYCDGTYGLFVVYQIARDKIGQNNNDGDVYRLVYPQDKPCPPAILEPNNFWGPLLSQLTIFVDELFAFAPMHDPHGYSEFFKAVVLSPIGTIFVFLVILFDWTYPLYVLGVLFAVQTGRLMLMLYLIIKRMIPGAG